MDLQPLNPGLHLPTIRAEDVIRAPNRIRRVQAERPAASRFKPAAPAALAAQRDTIRNARLRFAPAGGGR
jgi:hypothetical protein